MTEPQMSHMEFVMLKLFSNSSGSGLQGCGLSHSPGAILEVNIQSPINNVQRYVARHRKINFKKTSKI